VGVVSIDAANRDGLTVAIVGAECTGKTTLARLLAEHYRAPWVPEYARAYLTQPTYSRDDVRAIARGQHAAESIAAAGVPLVFADTDLVVIKVWLDVRFGGSDEAVDAMLADVLAAPRRRAYLLAVPDIPWVADALREAPNDRPMLHARYQRLLQSLGVDYVEIGGTREQRRVRAIAAVDAWISR
jgi:NadR type nicotinamide-nucleotide adenylyltransferase